MQGWQLFAVLDSVLLGLWWSKVEEEGCNWQQLRDKSIPTKDVHDLDLEAISIKNTGAWAKGAAKELGCCETGMANV